MKESVPKDRNRMNISSLEQSDSIRPLTPQKKEIKKLIKTNELKAEYSTTPTRNINMNISHLKVPEPIKKEVHYEMKEKNSKVEKKEITTKSTKEEVGDKFRKEREQEIRKENKTKEVENKKDIK